MARRELSSLTTPLVKFIIPGVWIMGFGFAFFDYARDATHSIEMKWVWLLVWLLGSGLVIRVGAGMLRVHLERDTIHVSNYFREIVIPFAEIGEVTGNRWTDSHLVTIHLLHSTEFGDAVTFIPRLAFLAPGTPHPIAQELQAEIRRARMHRSG
jgi:hypothetical protein